MVQAKLLSHKVTFPGFPTFFATKGRKWRLLEKFPTFADFFGRSLLLQTARHFLPTFADFSGLGYLLPGTAKRTET